MTHGPRLPAAVDADRPAQHVPTSMTGGPWSRYSGGRPLAGRREQRL